MPSPHTTHKALDLAQALDALNRATHKKQKVLELYGQQSVLFEAAEHEHELASLEFYFKVRDEQL